MNYQEFQSWFKEHCPKLFNDGLNLSPSQLEVLSKDYGMYALQDILVRIDAYDKKKYKTLYRTVRNWMKIKHKGKGNNSFYVG